MKPRLPKVLEAKFSPLILHHIYSFLPIIKKEEHIVARSPNAIRDLKKIQYKLLNGLDEYFLRDLEDFMLEY
jgi:hypothetical protein